MFPADFQNLIVVFVKGIFFPRHAHPGKDQAAPAAYQVHFPFASADLFNRFPGNAAVKGHKVHPVFCVKTHYVNKIFGRQGVQVPLVMDDRIINGNRADHGRAFPAELLPEGLGVPVAGQVHDGFRPHINRAHDLFHFNVVILAVTADPKVHIDFCFQHAADAIGIQAFMPGVSGNNDGSICHPFPDKFRRTVFLRRYAFHFRGNDSLTGCFHLCEIFFCHFLFLSLPVPTHHITLCI